MKKSLFFTVFLWSSFYSQGKENTRFEKLELFSKVLHLVESRYYRSVDTEKLIEGAIKGMMDTLDPHSSFLNEEVFKKLQEDTQGEFGGLGVEVTRKEGQILVITAIEDTPAQRAGIRYGDRIVEINKKSTVGMSLEEAVSVMRGRTGTTLTIGILREGSDEVKVFKIKREAIRLKPVKSELIDDHYAYMRLSQFQKRSGESLEKALKDIKKQAKTPGGLKGMILDFRNNPGGLLEEAVEVASLFLESGVVVSTEKRKKEEKDIKYVLKGGYKDLETPIIVLINAASASASEIVAGALQDHRRAIVMGTQSFGKGSVQTIAKIDEKQGLKLTIAQYMTPKGRKIQASGISPDILSSEYEGRYDREMATSWHHPRESGLKNYLTATVETEEEKAERLKKEALSQEKKRKMFKREKEIASPREALASKRNPREDFQVIQAVKHLKSFELAKKMIKN